jgi:hypothetical protein
MSTRFTIICDTCDEVGPHIRRQFFKQGVRALMQTTDTARFFDGSDPDAASEEWGGFLAEHEYHELSLATEWRPPREPKVVAGPTHRLMPDGSIEPL